MQNPKKKNLKFDASYVDCFFAKTNQTAIVKAGDGWWRETINN